MPYTRNTRIQVTKHLHKTNYKAQVEYRYPITGLKCWENISDVGYNYFFWMIDSRVPIAWQADINCVNNAELDDVKGIDWAKAQIDEYHKLFDEQEFTPTVEYVKYP
jgi:hypothetical protein